MDHHTFHAVIYRNPFYVPGPQAPPANAAYYYPQPQQQQQQQQVSVMYQYPRMEVAGQDKMMSRAAAQQQQQHNGAGQEPGRAGHPSRETLQLFPLQPTFVLRHDKGRVANGSNNNDSLTSTSTATATATASASISEDSDGLESGSSGKGVEEAPALPFYDFFGLQSSGGR